MFYHQNQTVIVWDWNAIIGLDAQVYIYIYVQLNLDYLIDIV